MLASSGKILIILIAVFSCVHGHQVCYDNFQDFDNLCNARFGTKHGGKCYWVIYDDMTWDNAMAACMAGGGRLAEVYTGGEYQTVLNLAGKAGFKARKPVYKDPKKFAQWAWVGFKRGPTTCTYPKNQNFAGTYWQSAWNIYPKFVDTKAIEVAYEACDYTGAEGGCGVYMVNNRLFSHYYCWKSLPAICQISNRVEYFVPLYNKCSGKPFLIEFPACDVTNCLFECEKKNDWCRSFQFVFATKMCQLFTFDAGESFPYDAPDCALYTYSR